MNAAWKNSPGRPRRLALATAGILSLLTASGGASAQTAQVADAAAEDDLRVEEVVVTAQKRSENLQDVPIAISAITSTALAAQPMTNTQDLQQFVPGLNTSKTAAGVQVYLRGVGQGTGVPGAESPVALYLDGIYLGAVALGVFDLNNISQIEVLKGPQGTLFGRNATGGLINIRTLEPSATPGGKIDIGYGNYQTVTGHLYVTGPISDRLSGSFAAVGKDRGKGIVRNLYTGHDILKEESYFLQGKLRWELSDATTVGLNLLHGEFSNLNGTVEGIYPGALAIDGATRFIDTYTINNRSDSPNGSRMSVAALRVDHDLEAARLMSMTTITDYHGHSIINQFGIPGRPNPNNVAAQIGNSKNAVVQEITQEFQIQSPAGQDFQWIAGFFYFHDKTKLDVDILLDEARVQSFSTNLKTHSYSAFLQATKTILPRTRLTLGIRYTADTRALDGIVITPAAVLRPAATLPPRKTWREPTWRIALDYRFSPDLLGYASYNRGFKSGNYSNTAITNPPANPEIVDDYEVGLKADLFDDRLRVNVGGFYYKYKDIQLRTLRGASVFFYNAANSEMYGLDADFTAAISSDLSLSGGLELLHARYTNFPNGVANLATPIAAAPAGCIGAPNLRVGGTAPFICDLSGNDMVRAPKFSGNLNLQYETAAAGGELLVVAGISHVSRYFYEPDNILKQQGYTWLNASVTWTAPDTRTSVRLWGTNLTDEVVYANIGTVNGYIYTPGQPRMYGVSLERRF